MKNSVSDLILCDEYKAVERALREYPVKRAELLALKKYIAALCSCSILSEVGASVGVPSSPEERFLEALERDPEYRRLVRFVETMETALNRLDEVELTIVKCIYWRGYSLRETAKKVNYSHEGVNLIRKRAISCIALDLYPENMCIS
ncbi:hypothetical protein AGMMS50276_28600 [Synergistales bacterium]|nr:hypothetical protein AGMMS50276_28600 [Synergistales bacterium]